MKMSALKASALGLALSALAFVGASQADEVWTSPQVGEVVWQSDAGDTSVFTYEAGASTTYVYIEGLPGNIENRNTHVGYWMREDVQSGDSQCQAAITGPDGRTSRTWGRIEMRFQRRAFPTAWTMRMGTCFGPLQETVRARPVTG